MVKIPEPPTFSPGGLSTARYLQGILGDLIKLAEGARLESTEAMLLAAKIEVNHAVRVMSAAAEQRSAGRPYALTMAPPTPADEDK